MRMRSGEQDGGMEVGIHPVDIKGDMMMVGGRRPLLGRILLQEEVRGENQGARLTIVAVGTPHQHLIMYHGLDLDCKGEM
jgi:hypothetical protein